VLRRWRTWGCLALGAALWIELGAVRGATQWQVTATGYVVGLIVTSLVLGLVVPGPRYTTGALLVIPGAAALVTATAAEHPDLLWWLVTLVLGVYVAAVVHGIGTELRRLLPLLRHPRQVRAELHRMQRARRKGGLPLGGAGR
jgi:hypothetical protein